MTSRYLLASLTALTLSIYVTIFAAQTHTTYDLPTWLDLTEWPATLLALAAAVFAHLRREQLAALAIVAALMAFLASQARYIFELPIAFLIVTILTVAFLTILPVTWKPR